MEKFIWLIFAHFIGDWGLQNTWMDQHKGKNPMVMIAHCMVWTACISIALEFLGLFTIWKAVLLFTFHYLFDLLKCKKVVDLYLDQFLHICQCLIVLL